MSDAVREGMALEEMTWDDYRRHLKAASKAERIPQSATFELTPLCNFNCRMCYVHLQPEQMAGIGRLKSAEEWLTLAKELKEKGVLFLLLTGGEVFTRKDFKEIYESLSEMGFLITIYTNGYLLTKELIDWLAQRPPFKLRITLYGMSDDTYQKVCGVPDGFTKVKQNIEMLADRAIPFGLAMTIIQQNEADFEACRQFAEKLDVVFDYTKHIVKPVRGAVSDAEQVRLPEKECSQNCSSCTKGPFPETEDPFIRCGSKNRSVWISWDGKMSACPFISSIQSDPFSGLFDREWEELWNRIEAVTLPVKCRSCSLRTFCPVCPGEREAETGSMEKVTDQLCKKAEQFREIYLTSTYFKERG